MQEDEEKLKKSSQHYTRLAILSLFLLALLQGLHSFFFTIFFWISVGFGALAINYFIAAKREAEPNVQWEGEGAAPKGFQTKKNLFVIIISMSVGILIFISVIVSIFSSSKTEDADDKKFENTSTQETVQAQENQLTPYQVASKEYENQNYRQSISLCRKAIISTPENLDLLLLLGDNYGSLKQYDSSYIWFNKAYQLGARSAYLSHWMGYFYDEKGEMSRAIEFYKDALQQDSTRTQIYDRLAELIPEKASWYQQKSKQWGSK